MPVMRPNLAFMHNTRGSAVRTLSLLHQSFPRRFILFAPSFVFLLFTVTKDLLCAREKYTSVNSF